MTEIDDLYNEAEKLRDDGRPEEAAAKLQQLLAQDETYSLAHLALAVLLGGDGKFEEAVSHGKRACESDPDDAFCFTAMSITYQKAFAATKNNDYVPLAEQAMGQAQALQMRG